MGDGAKKEGHPNRGKVTQAEVKGVGLPSKRGPWLVRGGSNRGYRFGAGVGPGRTRPRGFVEVILGWPYGP